MVILLDSFLILNLFTRFTILRFEGQPTCLEHVLKFIVALSHYFRILLRALSIVTLMIISYEILLIVRREHDISKVQVCRLKCLCRIIFVWGFKVLIILRELITQIASSVVNDVIYFILDAFLLFQLRKGIRLLRIWLLSPVGKIVLRRLLLNLLS